MNNIAAQDMRQHLMLNQTRLNIAEDVAQEIEDYLDEEGQARFIGPVGKGHQNQERREK